ncbi:hypothetical protein ABMA28_013683, partial [Loxostege sticticalis]
MLKGRGRDPRVVSSPTPARSAQAQGPRPQLHSPTHPTLRTPTLSRAPLAKPEPDYEVVEFPSEQYVNAKLQPPPPPPPRPPTGHPAEAASCGLCGGGGARVRCTECGRRALCASCDDMYHRHPKRRHHQRQALSLTQMRDERPPLPPKAAPPVPPPRRHKMSGDRMSASPRPPSVTEQRNSFHGSQPVVHTQTMPLNNRMASPHGQKIPAHLQKLAAPGHLGSMPYLPSGAHHPSAPVAQAQANTLGHLNAGWGRPRNSLPGFNVPPNMMQQQIAPESWESPENAAPQNWGRPLRRGASVLELGGGMMGGACTGCAGCVPGWRYGSCASLDHQPWGAWPPPACCHPPPHPHAHPHAHMHAPQTPQPYRRVDSRAVSRTASRAGSRAASPAMSVRSRASRRTKHRTPSPPPLPSSDADSESETPTPAKLQDDEDYLGPPPAAANASWQCEHCTFVNEPGVRVCAVCCRTPTAAPKVIEPVTDTNTSGRRADSPKSVLASTRSVADSARSVADSARSVAESARGISRLDLSDDPPPTTRAVASPSPVRAVETRTQQNGQIKNRTVTKKERVSTGCGPSPPREESSRTQTNRLVTPTREPSIEPSRPRHDMAVGPSPPRDTQHSISVGPSPPRQNTLVRASPYKEVKQPETSRHSVSVGPSPPRENTIRASPVQKKSAGTSPPRDVESRSSSTSLRANVSNTGTSPPPQSISTQTYEVPNAWERAPSASRSRARRRFRDDSRRERSHSRHSLSSDTRESERSARTSGGTGGRWEWRETRDSSPGAEWSGSERRPPARLTRRASHLDLRRDPRGPPRRSSFYSQAASPEPSRAMSLEALAGAAGGAAAERGLELARLMADAERLGFSAAEVQAALAQSPAAPLAWLRERWPSLCAGVRAAAARLAPAARVSELEARAALARHRGAMWPAVTECVERHRRQTEQGTSSERRLRGRVWGSPAGADDDAAPPPRDRLRAEDSSDEFDGPPPIKLRDDDWMYLPLDAGRSPRDDLADPWDAPSVDVPYDDVTVDVASDLRRLLAQARVPAIPDDLLLRGLLSKNMTVKSMGEARNVERKPPLLDFIQSENDFIEAYNALTRSSPLPSVNNRKDIPESAPTSAEINSKRDTYDVIEYDSNSNNEKVTNTNDNNNVRVNHTSHNLIDSNDIKNPLPENITSNEQYQDILDNTMQHIKASHSPSPPRKNISSREETTDLTLNTNNQIGNLKEDLTSNEQIELETSPIKTVETVSSNSPTASSAHGIMTDKNGENINASMAQVIIPNNIDKVTPPIQKVVAERKTEKTESDSQYQEKSNNLNDIVDNTQRLIQQMKDEINSDINSIDSRNISQSEADSSSNESDISTEHESSYSDTEDDKETDEMSTNESETSEDDEVSNEEHLHERRPTIIHRTSSEENDQFEEAMDHIEDQIEDFKNTNIEILDSIARSLQEEHTISLEMNKPKIIKEKREDLNNNLFTEVNSFEEIYAELNSNSKEKAEKIRPNQSKNIPNGILTEQSAAAASNTKKLILNNSEMKQTTSYNETIQRNGDSIEKKLKPSSVEQPKIPKIDITKQTIAISTFKAMPPIKLIFSENNQMALNAIIEDLEENIEFDNEKLDNTVLQITEETTFENNLIITEAAVTSMNSLSGSSDEDDSMGTADSDVTPTDQTDLLDNNDKSPENMTITQQNLSNDKDENVETSTLEATQQNLNTDIQTNYEEIDNKSKSPEKTFIKPPSESKLNKTFNAIKSNIPKLVKVVQNNKPKGDKTSPKVIASKVPVRRGSLKQYPAPAPPKSHFGNIQSGHVKQLQTRLFDNKFPKTAVAVPSTIEAKPSTSTMHKKKPAPPPPTQGAKQPSPSKASPPKEKKNNFFRESCRTEDEWTESDAEDTPMPVFSKESEEPNPPPSPPPPVTVRRVSGQIIDLAKVRLPEGSPERQARMLLAEGASETWEQARLAVELVSRGTEAADALLAALECADLASALVYLHQDCELCAERLPEHE